MTLSSRVSAFAGAAFAACAMLAILAGCSGQTTTPSTPSGAGAVGLHRHGFTMFPVPFMGMHAVERHTDRNKSWRSPKLKHDVNTKLLFISDFATSDVYIYSLPLLTVMATLTGFDGPQGMCSDNMGDVWITNTYAENILEYSHSGTLINTLSDPDGLPVGCAWQRSTGNLAVTNIFDNGGSQPAGEVLIYPEATGAPTAYTDPDLYYYYSVGFDNHGNLFVDGTNDVYPNYSFVLGELHRHASSISTVTISGATVYSPGNVEWSDASNDLIVGDQECNGTFDPETSCLYEATVSANTATVTNTINLNNSGGQAACDVVQAVRVGAYIYGGDFEYSNTSGYGCASGGSVSSQADRWRYPQGSNPLRFSTNSLSEPDGTAISN